MDDYTKRLIDNVYESYRRYKIAMREYLESSYIDNNGELIYPVSVAARVNDTKEAFVEAYKTLQIAKNINSFEEQIVFASRVKSLAFERYGYTPKATVVTFGYFLAKAKYVCSRHLYDGK